ncbi:transposase [Streptomyces alfalfae]|uniref:transposase n=1 Tax=Streptomyces alfalfae TaxID=1642299 RepID=UPI000975F3FF|nr:transposase [Streptomyces alfalfae]
MDHGGAIRRHELTDREWELLAPLIPRAATGRPRVEDRQVILMMTVVVSAAAALATGYLLGRLRPWQRAGDWAADQVRHSTGAWVQGGAGRQAVVVLVHVVTAPRTSWRIMRAPATTTEPTAPVRDPDWVANRSRQERE